MENNNDSMMTVQMSKELFAKLMTSQPGEQLRMRMTPEFQMYFADSFDDLTSANWIVDFTMIRGDIIVATFTRQGWEVPYGE